MGRASGMPQERGIDMCQMRLSEFVRQWAHLGVLAPHHLAAGRDQPQLADVHLQGSSDQMHEQPSAACCSPGGDADTMACNIRLRLNEFGVRPAK